MEVVPAPTGALDMNFAGVFLNDAVGDQRPRPGAAPVTGLGGGLGSKEGIVDALEVLGRDAAAGVGDCAATWPLTRWRRAGCRRRAWLPWR